MTKPELINAVVQRTGMKKRDIAMAVDAILNTVTETLAKEQTVTLVGFGTFDVRKRRARTGRNPRTGERITIPATTSAVFRAGRRLRGAVAG